ncbi:hypothetical protein [Pseudoalteromonas sp. SWYJZ19]|uniref:hypothetical protein n=1 Tax=Pseudoalteromonas sp. SWYJZ19 TaxID=2792068 RepID=UPI0018CEE1B0|nr:hypothetical protein [Pseudoalteromonas sp. SWYJZ19]MBH0052495.1 hypothetical protein [Pseudoalteromonas sp. SWYJZ19]
MDIFTPIFPEEKLHKHFKILQLDSAKPIRATINNWAKGFIDRDRKLVQEFQTTFNSSFWELYLFQCFKELEMKIDFSKASPDFSVQTKSRNYLSIEAVTANHALKDEPEWSSPEILREYLNKPRNEILEYASIRLLNAIDFKHKKFLKSYGKMEHVKGNPFILAIASFEQPAFFRQNNQAINRVLYGCDAPKMVGSKLDGSPNFNIPNIDTVKKSNGSPLELGVFTTDKFKEISAVIFSTTATFSKALVQSEFSNHCTVSSRRYKCGEGWFGYIDQISEKRVYKETHLDGLHIYHNPFADNPLDIEDLDSYEITQNTFNKVSKEIEPNHTDGSLISRSTHWEFDK